MASDDSIADQETAPFRWSGTPVSPDFVMVPKVIHREILRHLSGAQFKVFYALLMRAYEHGNGCAEMSIAEIEAISGVSRRMARLATGALEGYGLIEVTRQRSATHGHEASAYHVLLSAGPGAARRAHVSPGTDRAETPAGRMRARRYRKKAISLRLRLRVYERDAYACQLCGAHQALTLDHIVPESKGGPTALANLRVLCRSCNSRKGVRDAV